MPIPPPSDDQPDDSTTGSRQQDAQPMKPPPLERTRFGGTQRRPDRELEGDAPVSRSDLSKGPEELLEHRSARTNWTVLVVSSLVILVFSIWAIVNPDGARTAMKAAVDWIALNLGWYYVVTVTLVIGFVLWVALSKEGRVRLGPDHSRPEYKLSNWVAMLFTGRVARQTDVYYRLEVFTQTGSGGWPDQTAGDR